MNKNAYEIRLELLRMAHDDAMQKYQQIVNIYLQKDNGVISLAQVESSFPKPEEIIKRAGELYKFIERTKIPFN